MTKKLYLIDGSGFIFRAYHALPPLTRSDKTPVGAVYGFLTMIMKLMEGKEAGYMAVIFDAARITFRNRIYDQYKAHRPPAPEDLIPQFPLVRDATDALGLPRIEVADYEADDVIATYAKQAREQGMEVVIVSSDKDLMQLIGDGVSMYDAMKQKQIGPEQVREKFGVGPEQVRDVLSMIGDSSDNIPGIPGIGPKTAAELIAQFGSLEGVLTRAAEIKQPKRRDTVLQNIEQARLSHELIGLIHDVPVPIALDAMAVKPIDNEVLLNFARLMEFKSLINKLAGKGGGEVAAFAQAPANRVIPAQAGISGDAALDSAVKPQNDGIAFGDYTLISDAATLSRWIDEARRAGIVAFDTETTSLNAMQAELVGFSLSSQAGKACYVPVGHVEGKGQEAGSKGEKGNRQEVRGKRGDTHTQDLFSQTQLIPISPCLLPNQLPLADALAQLKPLLEDAAVLKIGQNIKYDMLVLAKYGVRIAPIDDTMLLSYALDAGRYTHGMDALSERYLGHKPIAYDEVTGTGRARITFAEVPLDKACAYAAEDADVTYRLHAPLKSRMIAEHMTTLYETIERPLVPVITAMEARGIKVDRLQLEALSKDFAVRMQVLEREIHTLAGGEFNVASPKQLGEIIFEKLKLAEGKKSKTGAYGTDAGVLEELAEAGHVLPARVLDWRQLAKLKSTYTDALHEQINPKTGRVHTSFAMAIASTGRLSSSDPNLQNIPIRTDEGKRIRAVFIAEKGNKLIAADYSQIELRLLAHIAGIDTLKAAFKNGDDIHAITASQMFGVAVNEVNGDLRRKAKTINFGIIYGISAHGLAARLGISRSEAGSYIESYFAQYPGIKEYMERTKEFARAHGYVTTLYGRKCHLPDILSKNAGMRQFSERAAINAPLQGTAADIIKKAMLAVEHAAPGHMLLQVHDELVLEAPEDKAQAIADTVKKHMETVASLDVPLEVQTGVGDDWGQIH